MKRLLAAGAVLALALGTAQAQTTTTTRTQETTGSISIAPEHRTVIKQYVTQHKVKPVEVKEKITVGSTVPSSVELMSVPDDMSAKVPSIKQYRYFVWNDEVVFVDPATKKVVQIIE